MEQAERGHSNYYVFGEGGNHYLGESEFAHEQIAARMDSAKTINFFNVRQVVTFNIPGPKGINRLTRLVTVDVALGPVPVMIILPTSLQPILELTPALRELIKSAEDDETKARAGRAGLSVVE
jgi:hypothetical protein